MQIDYPGIAQIPELKKLWKLAFADTYEDVEQFFTLGFSQQRCRCVIADGQVVAALYWFDTQVQQQHFAYLYAVATHPDHRNQGLCRALMADTLKLLQNTAFSGAILKPETENLARMYGTMGFLPCTSIREFSCRASSHALPIRKISTPEYEEIRQKLLPEGGVIQNTGDLQLLAAQAQLYAGEDFLLAATSEGTQLRGIELLGNPDIAPGILAALGMERGSFRAPGTESPFTSFCPLREHCIKPSYFGIVLD